VERSIPGWAGLALTLRPQVGLQVGDYERSEHVDAPPDALFDYLAEVGNLPRYFAAMTRAEPAGGDALQVSAVVDGQQHDAQAWLRVDRDRKHLDWGSEGPNNYHGRLDVTADGQGSQVAVALHTEEVDDQRITQGLTDTLDQIRRLVEAGPAPATD
jgi:hypothetical protein